MKILAAIVIPPHLSASGAVNAAIALSKSLARHCDIDVAMMSDHESESHIGDLRVMQRHATNRLSFTKSWLPNKFRTLFYRSDISSLVGDYDLVHIHNPLPALEMQRIARACVAKKIPYVVTTHGFVEVLGMEAAYQLGKLEMLAGKFFVTRPLNYVIDHAFKICCLAPHDQSLLSKRGVPMGRMVVIPNGVDPSYFDVPAEVDVANVCHHFSLPRKEPSTPVCFFLANHTRNKGLDILLDAFLASTRSYCLVVGGKKRDYDYKGYAARVKNNQRIVFTDGLTDREIRCLHHYADLFVFPTRADTLPLVVLEAMASGRPVLSTVVGGIPFQIDDSCGKLVEPEKPEAFRLAFEQLVEDRHRLTAMGQAACAKVRAEFDWEKSASMTMEVYREAQKNCPGRGDKSH
jgi:alpha-maltose-1-phosphate synthase